MNSRLIVSIVAALATGTFIAVQSAIGARLVPVLGAARAGVLVNAIGGVIAAVGLLVVGLLSRGAGPLAITGLAIAPQRILFLAGIAGILGILIVGGVSFSVAGAGVAAGLSAVILAQLVVGLVLDAVIGSGDLAAAFSIRRIAGIGAMALGVWLLVPRG